MLKLIEETVRSVGWADKEGDSPSFEEFSTQWVAPEHLAGLVAHDGGHVGPITVASLAILHAVTVAQRSGGAVFEVSTDLLDGLMHTDIPDLPISELKVPFEGFYISVPKGRMEGRMKEVTRVYVVHVPGDKFRVVMNHGEWTDFVNFLTDDPERTVLQAADRTFEESKQEMPKELWRDLQQPDVDFYQVDAFRLAVNLVFYLSCEDADVYQDKREEKRLLEKLAKVGGGKGKGKKKGKGGQRRLRLEELLERAKKRKVFIVGAGYKTPKELKAELTEEGKSWVLKHRFRVRGHWRMQAFGEGLRERKRIWIAPHWKGPTYAEMLERGYVVR